LCQLALRFDGDVVGSDEFNKNIGDFLQAQNVTKKSINFDKH